MEQFTGALRRFKKSGCCNTATELQYDSFLCSGLTNCVSSNVTTVKMVCHLSAVWTCMSKFTRKACVIYFTPTVWLNSLIVAAPLKWIDVAILNAGMTGPLVKGEWCHQTKDQGINKWLRIVLWEPWVATPDFMKSSFRCLAMYGQTSWSTDKLTSLWPGC